MIPAAHTPHPLMPIVGLFEGGKGGAFYNFQYDLGNVFTDTALTTRVTAAGQAIAGVKDWTANVRNILQGTTANRPTSAADKSAAFAAASSKFMFNSAQGACPVGTCIMCCKIDTSSANTPGIVTNTGDQAVDVDYAFVTHVNPNQWETSVAAGNGLATSRYWQDLVQQLTYTTAVYHVFSVDGTERTAAGLRRFPNGIMIGRDRGIGRYLTGNLYAVFCHEDILPDATRIWVEKMFAAHYKVFAV